VTVIAGEIVTVLMMVPMEAMTDYRLLGRSGLRVSPLALGAMTFGASGWAGADWGADEADSRAILDRYLAAGGNFVDTAVNYGDGASEELLGRLIEAAGARERIVLATKFTATRRPGDPNAAGNGRKNVVASLETSLRRLRTDYVDLYWLHLWDTVTPVEEVLATLDALVRSGKVLAFGLSNVPAWYAARAQVLADARGWEPIAALQLEHSLLERTIEREHVPAALELGMGIVPWSPLASGFLTGKYTRGDDGVVGDGRIAAFGGSVPGRPYGDREWRILDVLREVAGELGRPPAEVALAWVTSRRGVSSTLIGARTTQQLDANMRALEVELPPEAAARLDAASEPEPAFPYRLFTGELGRSFAHGGASVRRY
jgi:aryl-alcohol dehydrogenase-like predicted oxidoreductase